MLIGMAGACELGYDRKSHTQQEADDHCDGQSSPLSVTESAGGGTMHSSGAAQDAMGISIIVCMHGAVPCLLLYPGTDEASLLSTTPSPAPPHPASKYLSGNVTCRSSKTA